MVEVSPGLLRIEMSRVGCQDNRSSIFDDVDYSSSRGQ